jgi:LacI family kdg operon repressor
VGSEVSHNVWGKVVSPGLSMIRIPGYAIGWSGCMRLIERLRGDESPRHNIQIPSELVIRQSTPGPRTGS